MRTVGSLLLTVSLLPFTHAFPDGHRDIYHDHFGQDLHIRNIVYNGQIADSYDFVIVGGGTAGLAIAARLSEDSNTTVLVLEAGDTGDGAAHTINTPVMAYYAGLPGSSYDWAHQLVNQVNAGNRSFTWPCGKVLGGSSAMNGMYHIRPSKIEVDAWASLIDGDDKWNWDNFVSAMQASETFTPPSSDVQKIANIEYSDSSRGHSGPIHVTYPGFEFTTVGSWTQTFANMGIEVTNDAYSGDNWGAYVSTSSINPSNWTRSYARSGYIDPLPPRDNLAILPNATVTRLLFDESDKNNLTATGVEWAVESGSATQSVKVRREVIISAGTMGSPHVLMLSGVGPSDVLQAAGVPVKVDLPGVGQHLQDHISTGLVFNTNTDTAASLYASNATGNTPEFLSYINSATAYVNLTGIFGEDGAATFIQQVSDALSSSVSSLVPSDSDEVKKGYQTIYNTSLAMLSSPVAQVEILLSLTGSGPEGTNIITIQAGLQHTLSQGRLWITSADPFVPPAIDPQYLSHPADTVVLRESLKLVRRLAATEPLSGALQGEVQPGESVQTDEEWDAWLAQNIGTEFHPSSSCAMLPKEQGGVVDADLKVYGLGNVRVTDASVYPIQLSAHLQAPTYGLAEQAARIIRATYNGVGWPSSGSGSGSGTGTGTGTGSPGSDENAAQGLTSNRAFATVLTLAVIASMLI